MCIILLEKYICTLSKYIYFKKPNNFIVNFFDVLLLIFFIPRKFWAGFKV